MGITMFSSSEESATADDESRSIEEEQLLDSLILLLQDSLARRERREGTHASRLAMLRHRSLEESHYIAVTIPAITTKM